MESNFQELYVAGKHYPRVRSELDNEDKFRERQHIRMKKAGWPIPQRERVYKEHSND